jgi:hypothetical protein
MLDHYHLPIDTWKVGPWSVVVSLTPKRKPPLLLAISSGAFTRSGARRFEVHAHRGMIANSAGVSMPNHATSSADTEKTAS